MSHGRPEGREAGRPGGWGGREAGRPGGWVGREAGRPGRPGRPRASALEAAGLAAQRAAVSRKRARRHTGWINPLRLAWLQSAACSARSPATCRQRRAALGSAPSPAPAAPAALKKGYDSLRLGTAAAAAAAQLKRGGTTTRGVQRAAQGMQRAGRGPIMQEPGGFLWDGRFGQWRPIGQAPPMGPAEATQAGSRVAGRFSDERGLAARLHRVLKFIVLQSSDDHFDGAASGRLRRRQRR